MCVSQGMGVTILPEMPYDYLPLNDKYYSLRETANDDAGFWYRLRRCYKADFKSQNVSVTRPYPNVYPFIIIHVLDIYLSVPNY